MNMNWKYHNPKFEYEEAFQDSAWPWSGHKFFAYDLIVNLKPERVVELGTHYGTSLWSFAQAVKGHNIHTELNAVDTWEGEKHAGFYGEEVFETVNEVKKKYYHDLKINLIRKTFDEALADFKDNSIDVLHIDGLHTYEAVKHDFESWLPKMKESGMVLFHDIKVGELDFGVYKLWEELKKEYVTMEFHHSFGLGILFLGKNAENDIVEEQDELQRHYYYLHESIKNGKLSNSFDTIKQKDQELQQKDQELQQKDQELQQKDQEIVLMKESKFWKLREKYLRLKNKIKF